MQQKLSTPAISFVGRHNSGKTTLIEKLIKNLVGKGFDIGSIKHHGHVGFEFDVPGKDSYRHREAGTSETIVSSPGGFAHMCTTLCDLDSLEILDRMQLHDLVVVEGFRKSALPCVEIMRSANEADMAAAKLYLSAAKRGLSLESDFSQIAREHKSSLSEEFDQEKFLDNAKHKMPQGKTVAIVTDIDEALEAAEIYGIDSFHPDDIENLALYLQQNYIRQRLSVVIQAGGESRRMGQSKATVPFLGRPLITRLVSRLHCVSDELLITTNEPDNLAFLADEFPDLKIRLVRDAYDYRGALPGLFTAINAAENPLVAVIACDMIFASPALLSAEVDEIVATNADAVVPTNKHGFEPFHAVYRKRTCLPAIKRALDLGKRRAQGFYEDIKVQGFAQDKVIAAEPMGRCFVNANTPDELNSIEVSLTDGSKGAIV